MLLGCGRREMIGLCYVFWEILLFMVMSGCWYVGFKRERGAISLYMVCRYVVLCFWLKCVLRAGSELTTPGCLRHSPQPTGPFLPEVSGFEKNSRGVCCVVCVLCPWFIIKDLMPQGVSAPWLGFVLGLSRYLSSFLSGEKPGLHFVYNDVCN